MKLDSPTSVFNMGDTSIRVKQLVEVNRLILKHLDKHVTDSTMWSDKHFQEDFYKSFIDEIVRLEKEDGIELFSDFKRSKTYSVNPSRIGMRGRTLTNAIMKVGLINQNRQLSSVGKSYLNSSLKDQDKIEQILGLSEDNLVYLRQFLKLRIYSSSGDRYFYNFRFALAFLSKYSDVPKDDFLWIVESIRPEFSDNDLEEILSEYRHVSEGDEIFTEYYKRVFAPVLRSEEVLNEVKQMFQNNELSDENFIKYFNNRDNNATSLLYKDFVINLLSFASTESDENYQVIKKLSRNSKIKKAFGERKTPFKLRGNMSKEEFISQNKDNLLLSGDGFQIYLQFIYSKNFDLIVEYSDMCRRAFQVTGLISFENGLANLNNEWLITPLINILGDQFLLTGNGSYEEYERIDDSKWFSDLTTTEILEITDQQIDKLYEELATEFDVKNISEINDTILDKRETEYRTFIENEFPVNKVIEILENIKVRNDEQVFELVTDNATVPTIYEYILTIAWYHISSKKNFMVHKLFQVSLDGSKLPLTHRGGGAGDIEIVNDEYALLIEATLMDMSTQKRGEMEPVLRHSINFAIDNDPTPTHTIFIANELDNNVMNVFRASKFIEFNGTYTQKSIVGVNIFALTTNELIEILSKNITDETILSIIEKNTNIIPSVIKNNWRDMIINELLE